MNEKYFKIGHIPAVLYGEQTENVWIFLHGRCGCKEEGAAFAETVCPRGCQVLSVDLPEHGARAAGDVNLVPWTVRPELQAVEEYARAHWASVSVRANSIGAYFAMLSMDSPDKALLVSPILDMERLILDMLGWAGATEAQLRRQAEIQTSFGETLSWAYLCYVRTHPVHHWRCPIYILYAGQDTMTSRPTAEAFVEQHDARLTVMEAGEHWFHTPEQLAVLRKWEQTNIDRAER